MNNNINFNPFIFQPNIINNDAQINFNPNQFEHQPKSEFKINVKFYQTYGKSTMLQCKANEIISEVIGRYREKSKDYNENFFFV